MSRTSAPLLVHNDPTPGGWTREGEDKRQMVLRAAAQAFAEDGYAATSIDDIAARLGVSKPTIYYHAGGKQALLEACFSVALDAYSVTVDDERPSERSARERLYKVVEDYVHITTTVFGRCLHRVPDIELTPEGRSRLRMVKRKVDARLRMLMREGVRDGSLRIADVRMSTFAISGAMNSIAQWYSPDGPLGATEIAERIWDVFMEGLRPR